MILKPVHCCLLPHEMRLFHCLLLVSGSLLATVDHTTTGAICTHAPEFTNISRANYYNDLRANVSDGNACCTLCYEIDGCEAYVHDSDNNTCYFKNAVFPNSTNYQFQSNTVQYIQAQPASVPHQSQLPENRRSSTEHSRTSSTVNTPRAVVPESAEADEDYIDMIIILSSAGVAGLILIVLGLWIALYKFKKKPEANLVTKEDPNGTAPPPHLVMAEDKGSGAEPPTGHPRPSIHHSPSYVSALDDGVQEHQPETASNRKALFDDEDMVTAISG